MREVGYAEEGFYSRARREEEKRDATRGSNRHMVADTLKRWERQKDHIT
jgi:hypothetical protein